jgi:hypothetical protein
MNCTCLTILSTLHQDEDWVVRISCYGASLLCLALMRNWSGIFSFFARICTEVNMALGNLRKTWRGWAGWGAFTGHQAWF